jgi:uncharacterized membrane protein YphA (DoxX/SURF4 family)
MSQEHTRKHPYVVPTGVGAFHALRHLYDRLAARATAQPAAAGLDVVRAFLGVALFMRGVMFMKDTNSLAALIDTHVDWFWPVFVAHYVGLAHLAGGALLALGLVTRIAAAAQLPVLLGAVFLVHWQDGLMTVRDGLAVGGSLELAALVLVLLAVFSVVGAGPWSVQSFLDERAAEQRAGHSATPRRAKAS